MDKKDFLISQSLNATALSLSTHDVYCPRSGPNPTVMLILVKLSVAILLEV